MTKLLSICYKLPERTTLASTQRNYSLNNQASTSSVIPSQQKEFNHLPVSSKQSRTLKRQLMPRNSSPTILGMITYLNRYSTKLAQLTAPLRELTKKHVHFRWEHNHQQALDKIKEEICTSRILSYYDLSPTTTTVLQYDACQEGLGAWIRQVDSNNQERIIAMASRSLNN